MSHIRINGTAVLLLVGFALGACTSARAADWVVLGERVVNDRVDHDTIVVGGSPGRLEAIKLRVQRRPVHFIRVTVHFGNGESQEVALRSVIPAGGETRAIDLVGDDRIVTRVEFTYEAETRGRGKRSKVVLLGRR